MCNNVQILETFKRYAEKLYPDIVYMGRDGNKLYFDAPIEAARDLKSYGRENGIEVGITITSGTCRMLITQDGDMPKGTMHEKIFVHRR